MYRNIRRAMLSENEREGHQGHEFWEESYDDGEDPTADGLELSEILAAADLSRWESILIDELFTQGKTVREVADSWMLPRMRIQRDKEAVLSKIRDSIGTH